MNRKILTLLLPFTRTPWRSLSILLSVMVITLSCFFLLILEKNALSAIRYYEYSPLDERRFSISENVDLFSLFSRDSRGIEPEFIQSLKSDTNIASITTFTLVEAPVLARFGMFQFSLETDIPVFAVSDHALTGAGLPFGISQILLDFYNKEFAGSTAYFPFFTKDMILGQSISLEFGKSKLFPSSSNQSTPLVGKVRSIKNDYPGFGIMVGESVVRSKLEEIGVSVGNPYKLVGYMKDPQYKDMILAQYAHDYRVKFDSEVLQKIKEKTSTLRSVLFGIGAGIFFIFLLIFLFLLFGYARERSDIYRLFQSLGISGVRPRLFLLFEPIFLILSGLYITYIFFFFIQSWILISSGGFLIQRGIDFPVLPIQHDAIMPIIGILLIIIVSTVLGVDWIMRRKQWI